MRAGTASGREINSAARECAVYKGTPHSLKSVLVIRHRDTIEAARKTQKNEDEVCGEAKGRKKGGQERQSQRDWFRTGR